MLCVCAPVFHEGVHHAAVNDVEDEPDEHGHYVLCHGIAEAVFREPHSAPGLHGAAITSQQLQRTKGGVGHHHPHRSHLL